MVHQRPELVVIGDSTAGTRIDPALLEQLSGRRVFAILHPGTGPVFWYLALKNWVIASSVRPKFVFIFFRDPNLTDVMFRTDTWNVDRVAGDQEPEVNDAIASRIEWRLQATSRVERLYGADRARLWPSPRSVRQSLESSSQHTPAASWRPSTSGSTSSTCARSNQQISASTMTARISRHLWTAPSCR
jgi:hypothetical protein